MPAITRELKAIVRLPELRWRAKDVVPFSAGLPAGAKQGPLFGRSGHSATAESCRLRTAAYAVGRALEIVALLEWNGIGGDVANERAFVAEQLNQMTYDQFVERVKSLNQRCILIKRSDSVQIALLPAVQTPPSRSRQNDG
jgi:hypothetical protein